jgi:sulfoxide reductase heme-binding subunit YedZ
MPSGTALWYASRATGVVALVLLTAVVVLGVLTARQGRLPGLPGFAGLGLHRYLSLLAVAFIGVHVATAIADGYVSIAPAAAVIPFVSSYQPFWLGLGAVSADLMLAVIVTSLLRRHIGRRPWRLVHWLAYLCWPVALAHGIGSSTDLRAGPLLGLAAACTAAAAAAAGWRLTTALRQVPLAGRVAGELAGTQPLTRAGRP